MQILGAELQLKKDFLSIHESILLNQPGINKNTLAEHGTKELSPLILASLLNKKPTTRKRTVKQSTKFIIPEEHQGSWDALREKIELGKDFTSFLSRDIGDWIKADFLLFCSGVHHIHIATRRGVGTGKELIFGVFTDDTFYAILFGDHHDIYKPELLISTAEDNWPGILFRLSDKVYESGFYNKRIANDPKSHANIIKPAGYLDGHQHTSLITLSHNDKEIRNVPLSSFIAQENEMEFLRKIEDKLAKKHGPLTTLKLSIDFKRRKYEIKASGANQPYIYNFPKEITCSKIVAEKNIS